MTDQQMIRGVKSQTPEEEKLNRARHRPGPWVRTPGSAKATQFCHVTDCETWPCLPASLFATLDIARAGNPNADRLARAILENIQWDEDGTNGACRYCQNFPPEGHATDCVTILAAQLAGGNL